MNSRWGGHGTGTGGGGAAVLGGWGAEGTSQSSPKTSAWSSVRRLRGAGPAASSGSRSFEAIKASFRNTDRAHSTADRGCCCTGESGTKEVLPGGCGRGSYELLLRWWAARLGAACESVKSLITYGER